jgi:anti-sigma regulatory factor (Ser/Thr protein kinase)
MVSWLGGVTAPLGLSSVNAHALELCLTEAVTNIVSHAHAPGMAAEITIALWSDDSTVHAEITDDGRPFDPLAHELAPPPKDLESAPIGGLGIKLIRSFADHMSYRRCGATNRLTLSFTIRA